jgi:hypothetical protein
MAGMNGKSPTNQIRMSCRGERRPNGYRGVDVRVYDKYVLDESWQRMRRQEIGREDTANVGRLQMAP